MPKVSVIIPVYNVEPYLRECLDSVVNQTLQDIEIICVDDGSTDGSLAILEEYERKDTRIKVITQKNAGAGVARNIGMDMSSGEYLYFLDSDDFLVETFLETVIEKAAYLKADIIVFDYYRMDNATKELEYRNGLNRKQFPVQKDWFNYKDVPENILRIVNPTPWNKVYETKYIKNTKLKYLALSSTNDITFASLSVAMAEKIGYVPKAFLYYRINLKSSITAMKQKKLDNVITAVMSVKEQALQLEYAQDIVGSIQVFMIDNLLFALDHYAGKQSEKYYREYYSKLNKLFNEDFFKDITVDSLGNKRIYDRFVAVKEKSYFKLYLNNLLYGDNNKLLSCIAKILKSNKYSVLLYKFLVILRDSGIRNALNKVEEFVFERDKKFYEEVSNKKSKEVPVKRQSISFVTIHKRNMRVIVSMTSYPARINKVMYSIETILKQSLKPDIIILWLATEQFPNGEADLPKELIELKKYGLTIGWCSDLKSYKKLIPSLKNFPEDIVITVDDDLLYNEFMLEKLYCSYQKYPNSISCVRAHLMQFDNQGNLLPYNEWLKENSEFIDTPRKDLFATTGAGTLFPPHIFNEEIFNEQIFTKECKNADDVWVKIISMLSDIDIVLIDKQSPLKYVPGSQEECLWHENVNEGGNDRQIATLLERYNIEFNKVERDDTK